MVLSDVFNPAASKAPLKKRYLMRFLPLKNFSRPCISKRIPSIESSICFASDESVVLNIFSVIYFRTTSFNVKVLPQVLKYKLSRYFAILPQ